MPGTRLTALVPPRVPERKRKGASIMNRDRRTAIVVGVLFIVATTAALIGRVVLLDPILEGADILAKVAANQNQVAAGALFGLVGFFACPSIAIALYPVLRRHSEGLALGSVGLRIIEGVLYSIGAIAVLSMVTLARGLVDGGAPASSYLEASGALLMAVRSWAGMAGTLAFYPAGLMYYLVFYRARLIPRWLSGWGIVAVAMGFSATILIVFQVIRPMTTPQIVLNLPIFLQEMVLAVWLIAKGFSPPAIASLRSSE
jgi:hypothetical protein